MNEPLWKKGLAELWKGLSNLQTESDRNTFDVSVDGTEQEKPTDYKAMGRWISVVVVVTSNVKTSPGGKDKIPLFSPTAGVRTMKHRSAALLAASASALSGSALVGNDFRRTPRNRGGRQGRTWLPRGNSQVTAQCM